MIVRESVMVGHLPMTIETGRLAKQTEGSVLLTYGGTQVLVTVCTQEPRFVGNFMPLTCDYVEKIYAGGRIPGGFFKREARLRDEEIITCRLMDRPSRPLFAEGFVLDTQIVATVMSTDVQNRADMLALTGASAALHISSLPWDGPTAGLRVARVDGEFLANPTQDESAKSDMDIVVVSSREAIVMVEGGGKEISERDLADALDFAHESSQPVIDLIEEIRAVVGRPKQVVTPPTLDGKIKARVAALVDGKLDDATRIPDKLERYDVYSDIRDQMCKAMIEEMGDEPFQAVHTLVKEEFSHRKATIVRERVLEQGIRIDGRDPRTVRPIHIEPGLLTRTHGSALFQRGETQAIATTTLGTSSDEQKLDGLNGLSWKRFYLHYNFPPFSTGEVKFLRGPGRREVGHGALAERALAGLMPEKIDWPYTVRVVSETLESNGSSSMAAVCGGCLSLMDAGVPIKAPVAGIAMGLIKEGDKHVVLSDILGDEDHLGDMDFKVCGTEKGITSIQMDIKIKGLSRDVMLEALEQAKEGRLHILSKMLEALPAPRPELSPYAPRIVSIKVKPDQVRTIIGPGGKTIRGIVDQTGASIDVEDDGTVNVASSDGESLRKAIELVESLTKEPDIGAVYDGVVRRVADFGAFVEILPNWDGLVHISELAYGHTERVEDVCKEGDPLKVKVISIDDGKVRLSHRQTLPKPDDWVEEERPQRGPPRGGSRGGPPRGGSRGGPPRGGPRGGSRGGPPRGGDRGGPSRGGDRSSSSRGGERGDRPERERPERPERAERPERSSGGDRPERAERPERSSGAERPERPERSGERSSGDRGGEGSSGERSGTPRRTARTRATGGSGGSDREE